MKYELNSRKAFTLIELLVVVLILGILAALAIPSYLSSVATSRQQTAQSNTQAIANAVQADYVKNGYTSYSSYNGITTAPATVLGDLGGIPTNPCTGGNALGTDYTLVTSTGQAANSVLTITAANGGVCVNTTPPLAVKLGY